jgi:acyl carrier protein
MYLNSIKKVISEEFFVDEELIKEDSRLKEDLGIDSLASMQLILDLEREYSIRVENEDVMNIETIKDIIDLLKKKVGDEE